MQKIRWGQLAALTIVMRTFTVICTATEFSASCMAGTAISTIAQALLLIPMLFVHKKGGFSMGKLMSAVFMIFFILWGAFSFVKLWGVMCNIYFPVQSKLFGGLMLAAVCFYASRLGIRALARASVFSLGLIAVSLAVMLFGSLPRTELSNFTPPDNSVWRFALDDFCRSGELAAIFVLMGSTKSGNKKAARLFIAGRFFVTELVAFMGTAVLGSLLKYYEYPFFAVGAYSQPFSIQRADGIYIVLFTVLCALTITIQIILSSMLLHKLLPKFKWNELAVILAMLLTASVLSCTGINLYALCGILLIILAAAIPIIAAISKKAVKA